LKETKIMLKVEEGEQRNKENYDEEQEYDQTQKQQ
jgi:hypothetical protein